ncbi:MAG: hypothetical protein HQ593_05850, partial [Candidatus Omnitrophica bacterium]|nr:hypothetical protein [Candidatus Omnitrophota bacterium]
MKKYFEVTHKKVFICNSAKRTEKFLKSLKSPGLRFAILDFKPSPQIKDFVSSLKGKDLTDKIFVDLDSFRSEYIRFMRDLNLKNRSLHWWAMNFTSKNPLLTGLYNRIFYVSRLARLIREEDFEHLIIFTSDVDIARKLKSMEGELGVKVSWSIKQRSALKNFVIRALPIAIIYHVFNVLCRRLLYLGIRRAFERDKRSDELYMIFTPFEDKVFKGKTFEDVYFCSLRNFFRQKGIKVMTVGLVSCKFGSLLANKEGDVFIFENFAKLSDITKHLIANLGFFFSKPKLKGLFKISNIDATDMVTSEIALSVNSGQIFLNLM